MPILTRPVRTREIPRSALRVLPAVVAVALVVAACGTAARVPSARQATTSGFPAGAFAKEMEDAELGHVRLVWRFEPDGRWAEIPLALDGQKLRAPVVRGTYVVDGDEVTLATEYPPGWGTSQHGWRLDGDQLWTFFMESDVPDDKEWYQSLDSRPWVPYE